MAQPILATGLNGFVGSKLAADFHDAYDFTNLDISHPDHPVDITNYDQVLAALTASSAKFVVHFAAFTDVNAAWEQRGDKNGLVYKVNVLGTANLVRAAEATGKQVIHISTAFVFDGRKPEPYTEDDQVSPIEWYGQTKAEAEEVVRSARIPWTILRIDFPFRSDPFPKPDIARKTIANIHRGLPLFRDHTFGPTYVDDFVKVIDWVIRTRTTGLFHASSGEQWTDYDFGVLLNDELNLGLEVKAGNLADYLKTTQRPYQANTSLNCAKLTSRLDFPLMGIREAVKHIRL